MKYRKKPVVIEAIQCVYCGEYIYNAHGNQKYCSDSCMYKARYERSGIRSTPEQRSKWYKKRKQKDGYIEKLREQGKKRYNKVQNFLREYKLKKGCKECGYNENHEALEFDHVIGEKEFNVCNSKSITQAKEEIKKCEVVCSNCHKIRTYKRISCKPDIFNKSYEKVEEVKKALEEEELK